MSGLFGGAGAVKKIETGSGISGASSVDILLPPGYAGFTLRYAGLLASDDAVDPYLRFSNDGGATFKNGATDYADYLGYGIVGSAISGGGANTKNRIAFGITHGNVAGSEIRSGEIHIYGARDSGTRTQVTVLTHGFDATPNYVAHVGGGQVLATEVNDALRLIMWSGTIDLAQYELYGWKG